MQLQDTKRGAMGVMIVLIAASIAVAGGVSPSPSPPTTWPKTLTNSIGMEFVLVPAGAFMMGSKNGEPNERPVHQVTITQPFYLGKYEVTQGQWEAVMGSNPSGFRGDPNRPVENIAWEQVQQFIHNVNDKEKGKDYHYRLPTEAEWEYAARAGSTAAYSFGDDPSALGNYAWYRDNAKKKTRPVGQLKPNKRGLYDMHGNVWEWVQDWYGKYPGEAVTDPQGPSSALNRILRGGGWDVDARLCQPTYRLLWPPDSRDDFVGFRLLRTAP